MINSEKNLRLIEGLKKRDLESFSAFYDRYTPLFYGCIKKELYRQDVSELVLKDVFCCIWKTVGQLDPSKEPLLAWSMKLVRKEIRKRKIDLMLCELFACQQLSKNQIGEPTLLGT